MQFLFFGEVYVQQLCDRSLVSLRMGLYMTSISSSLNYLVFLFSPILVLFCYERIDQYRKLGQTAGITTSQLSRKFML